jgi:hypothetical protein
MPRDDYRALFYRTLANSIVNISIFKESSALRRKQKYFSLYLFFKDLKFFQFFYFGVLLFFKVSVILLSVDKMTSKKNFIKEQRIFAIVGQFITYIAKALNA